jgi:rhomboid family GlyGly-CTERM serine protease
MTRRLGAWPLFAWAPFAWPLFAAALCAPALLAWWLPASALDWQPQLAATQPWRAFTAAWVHWSPLHLGANLLAAGVVAAYGWAARVPLRDTAAWAVAWPLTQLALGMQPDLAHYGGLSGVLHAGVAIVCLRLLTSHTGVARAIGVGVALGLVAKLVLEDPLGASLRHSAEWDIAVAPLAHTTGALAGVLAAGLCALLVAGGAAARRAAAGR